MHPYLDGVERRLARARAEIATLESYISASRRNLKRNRTVVDVEDDGLKHTVRVYFTWKPPEEWGLMVGEIVHHLRSVLDNFAYQLVAANGQTPTSRTEFPVALKQDWFDRVAGDKLSGVDPRALAEIRRLQPFARTDGGNPSTHWLWVIHQLDIVDKHQLIHVCVAVPGSAGYTLRQSDLDCGCIVRMHFRPLENGTPLMEFLFTTPQREAVQVDSRAALQIALAETERTPYVFFPGQLSNACNLVSTTIREISATTL